jgi:hypothetical protein
VIDRYAFKTDSSGYLNNLRDHLYLFDVATKKAEAADNRDLQRAPAILVARRHEGSRSSASAERIPIARTTPTVWVVDAKPGATPQQLTTFTGPDEGVRRGAPTASGSPIYRAMTSATTPTT